MKLKYNAPAVLTFSLICTVVLIISGGVSETGQVSSFGQVFTLLPKFSFSNATDYFRLFSHSLGHANWEHLIGNLSLILVVGPSLEDRYGSMRLLLMIFFTAFVSALISLLFTNHALLGASGIVFMMITLSSFGNVKQGEIPITLILVAFLYIGKELVQSFENDNISQLTHIVGGVCGGALGFYYAKSNVNVTATQPDPKTHNGSTETPSSNQSPQDEYL